jgi:hypothetical protein
MIFTRNLQIQFTAEARSTVFISPQSLLSIRQTATTLEFLHRKTNDVVRCIVVQGTNLGILRRSILAGTASILQPGPQAPKNAGVFIASITESPYWTIPTLPMAPDPNAVPRHCLQFETGLVRDVWAHAHLEAFAIPRGKEELFLFQFRGDWSYICTPLENDFGPTLAELKKSNLDTGMVNKFSAVTDALPNLPGVAHDRFLMEEIKCNHRNYAAESRWDVVMDYRGQPPSPGISMGI